VHALAIAILALGITMEAGHARVGFGFVAAMSILIVLLMVAAYALAAAIPLDAVLDDRGVTFAGATRAWASVDRIEAERGRIRVRSAEGDLLLGPGAPEALAPLARAIEGHLRARG
jgi:hypothetical protein